MYKKVEVSERQLEDLVRQHAGLIEEGMVYLTHQSATPDGRLDVLLVDSGKSLVVAELKVVEDDAMLMQCLDYYDYVSTGVETYARMHSAHGIDPAQPVRMLLLAPSFSQTLLNRCKWIDANISLFTYVCLQLEGQAGLVPIFTEQGIPSTTEPPPPSYKLEENLAYIADPAARARAHAAIDQVRARWQSRAAVDPVKGAVSLKVDGRVVAYLVPRRKNFIIYTYNSDNRWTPYTVHNDDDLATTLTLSSEFVERRRQ